jgi:hypothetical protein
MGLLLFDQYTYLHFASGIVAYFWGVSIFWWFIFHTIFELLENSQPGMWVINNLITMWPGGKPMADSLINMIGDTIGSIIGWLSAKWLDDYGKAMGWY